MYTAWGEDTTQQKKVTVTPVFIPADVNVTKKSTEAYEAKTKNYIFTVQPDTFVYADGSPVEENIDAYFFDLNAETPNMYASGMLSLDVFNSVTRTNMGEGMITYGMPLVKAYKGDIELYIQKPIIGIGRMSNLEDFMKNNGLTEMNFATVPKNQPLDFARATQYKLPPFWQYKKRTGIWETSTFELIDATGLARFSFSDF